MAERRFLVIETEKEMRVYVLLPSDLVHDLKQWLYTIEKPLPTIINQAYQLVTKKEPL